MAGGAIAGLAAMGLVQGLLALIGFGPVGIIAGDVFSGVPPWAFGQEALNQRVASRLSGSAAAGIQSGIGNVAAGSLFAACQSVGAAGLSSGAAAAAGATAGGLAGVGAAVASLRRFW